MREFSSVGVLLCLDAATGPNPASAANMLARGIEFVYTSCLVIPETFEHATPGQDRGKGATCKRKVGSEESRHITLSYMIP